MKCIIVGGGASLLEPGVIDTIRKAKKEQGAKLFGCNHAFRHISDLDYLIYLDTSLYVENEETLDNFKGQIYTRCARRPQDAQEIFMVDYFRHTNPIESGVYGGGQCLLSGIAAVAICIMLGFDKIYLAGYDGGEFEGKTHIYHPKQQAIRYQRGNDKYEPFRGFPVYNCNPKSHINVFDKVSTDAVFD